MENNELLNNLRSGKLADINPQSRTEAIMLAIHGKVVNGVDTSEDTVTAETLLEGATAHDAEGKLISGAHICVKDPNVITDFSYFCANGRRLEDIENIPTGGGTDFSSMFSHCESLTSIPELDTGKGTSFGDMFIGCTSLTSIPELDTSKGTMFSGMFNGCTSLATIPELNTSNGVYFASMFCNCTSLTSIPELDTGNGRNFSYMFSDCQSLTSIPLLDTSNGGSFIDMFTNCVSLESIAPLKLSLRGEYSGMFRGCRSLKDVTFTGTIDTEGIDLSYSPLLSKDSITSLIDTLSSMVIGATVTISLTAVNNAFETSEGSGDGSTSDEWLALKATKRWNIDLKDSV